MNHVIQEKDLEWLEISEDLIPFLPKNQFKKALKSLYEKAMNPKTKKK